MARPGLATLVGRALRLRCPPCGRRPLLRGWFTLASRCTACGFAFERNEREDYWLGAYLLNFLNEETPDAVRAAFGGNYARLAALKAKYDPTNFFSINQNVKPAGAPVSSRSA